MTEPRPADCTSPCIACMTDESHDPAPAPLNPPPTDRAADYWRAKLHAVTEGRDGLKRENARLKRDLAHAERIRENADFRAATCPGECDSKEHCEHGRFQPTVWGDQQPVEVGISGPPERIAALIINALTKETP